MVLIVLYIVLAYLIFFFLRKVIFNKWESEEKKNEEQALIHQFNDKNPDFTELYKILNINNIPIEEE